MREPLKDHFIPHHGNEYKPHILQQAAMLGMVVLIVLSFTLANVHALIWISSEWMVSTILPAVIVSETNDERAGLVQLSRSDLLDQAAQLKAEHMAANEYFSHFAPDGTSPWYFFGAVDYGFVHAGENLAIHFNDSSEVVEAWMDSPTHRANIMNGDFTEIGIGVAEGSYEGYKTLYVVQLFGTPAAPAPIVVANESVEPEPVVVAAVTTPVSEVEVSEEPVVDLEPVETVVAGAEDEVVSEIVRAQEPVEITVTESVVTEVATETPLVALQTEPEAQLSDMISTSTGGVPATVDTVSSAGTTEPFFAFATQPQFVLQVLYATIGVFVVIALMLATLIEIRRQHPIQVAYSVALLLLMYGLYQVHASVTSGAMIV